MKIKIIKEPENIRLFAKKADNDEKLSIIIRCASPRKYRQVPRNCLVFVKRKPVISENIDRKIIADIVRFFNEYAEK